MSGLSEMKVWQDLGNKIKYGVIVSGDHMLGICTSTPKANTDSSEMKKRL